MSSVARSTTLRRAVRLLPLLLLSAAFGCPQPGTEGQADAEGAKVAAKVGDQTITFAELDRRIKDNLFDQATDHRDPAKLYDVRSQALEHVIDDDLLEAEAKARGMSKDDLLAAEDAKVKPVDQSEVQAFYDRVKSRLGDTKLEAVADQIKIRLQAQRRGEARTAFVKSLRDKAQVSVLLEPPRIQVAAEGPSRGPANAPVTIVEFSDYQCPFCKRVEPTVEELTKRYGDKVRLVYRHFPLDSIHPLARGASEASECAEEQGKFWEYHDLLFQASPKLDKASLRDLAGKANLDLATFDKCVAAGGHTDKIEADVAAGKKAGVSGTPAFFVNGIPVSGAQPIDKFAALIDKELAKAPQAAPKG